MLTCWCLDSSELQSGSGDFDFVFLKSCQNTDIGCCVKGLAQLVECLSNKSKALGLMLSMA